MSIDASGQFPDLFRSYFQDGPKALSPDERWEVYRLGDQTHPKLIVTAFDRVEYLANKVGVFAGREVPQEVHSTQESSVRVRVKQCIGLCALAYSIRSVAVHEGEVLPLISLGVSSLYMMLQLRKRISKLVDNATVDDCEPFPDELKLTDSELVRNAYANLLNRHPDPDGVALRRLFARIPDPTLQDTQE